jgi:hypothetical protein
MHKTSQEQLEILVESWNLTLNKVPVVCILPSFHDVSSEIRQRLDTKQYIIIHKENSWNDNKDDYFTWIYITTENVLEYSLENKNKNRDTWINEKYFPIPVKDLLDLSKEFVNSNGVFYKVKKG